ncbi:uncharacterized protein C5L36_0B05180 [Pichia kudriavzevii]|uniref:Pre-mRNA-splicing factor CWC22 n=2 Tax=Pichia kudriavzevii TaxID=4909 RepID=A0A2U9R1Y4_PICKU|nr:uncharacterized protein C5L36_0B05180 [Pichia kudriavzevii]AWU75271.1 hypothetical protein C5L36_0B05180 [Pichia kudriavzevii]
MSEKLSKLLKLKSGGAYVPPAKLRELMAQVELEENSKEFQILQWEALKKNINSSVNKVNKKNLKTIVVELFKNNLLQGRGLLCQCIMKSQQLSTSYTDVYASLVSIINSKIPEVGDLLVRRLIVKFKRLIRRNEAEQCRSVVVFLSELFNFHVINSELVQQIIDKLFENISDFRIEMIIEIMRHCGITLHDENGKWFDQKANLLRNVLNENIVNPKSQYLIQEFFDNFKGLVTNYNGIDESLDLVEEEDQITHNFTLSENVLGDDHLDVFKFDPNYEDNREKYNIIRKGILGSDVETDSDQEVDNESSDYSSDYDNEEEEKQDVDDDDNRQYTDDKERNKLTVQIKDLTEQELTTFQKNVYLTIMSSMSPEEATHKLLKLPAVDPKRKEYMLVDMVIKCCAQEKIYSKYYGLIGENLAVINKSWAEVFQALFKENYQNCHRYETALLRNIGAFWGHMFASDKIGWECLSVIKLTEEDTTSSGRIFIKFIFQRMVDELGDKKLNERISEDYIQPFIRGLFPVDNPDHLRFSINYFTAIGMGKLTDKMRSNLNILTEKDKLITSLVNNGSDSDESDVSSPHRGRSRSRSPHIGRSQSYSRSRSTSRERYNRGTLVSAEDRIGMSSFERERSYSRSRTASPARQNHKNDRTDNIPKGPRINHNDNGRGKGHGRGRSGWRGRGRGRGGYSANRSRYRTQENWNYAGRNGSNQFRDDLSYNKRHNDHQYDHPAANRDYYNRQRENR